jgi:hypothetical protein
MKSIILRDMTQRNPVVHKAVAEWLRHYATNRKVAGSRLDANYFYQVTESVPLTSALGFTPPLTERRLFVGGGSIGGGFKCGRCARLITYRHLRADCLDNVGYLTSCNPIGLQDL